MTVITPLGDIHHGQRTELIKTEDEAYIKKPRNFQTEAAFSLFCDKLADIGLPFFSRSPVMLGQGEGYHTQAVETNSPTTSEGADTYYYRAGILLCICYLFGSVDLHSENIIAVSDTPVIVDMETLLSGKARGGSARYTLNESVLCSHLLCSFLVDESGVRDVSGYCASQNGSKNIPHTEKGRVFPWEKEEALLSGFSDAYNVLSSNKEKAGQALHVFDSCSFRQLLRPTQTYHTLSDCVFKLKEDKRQEAARALLAVAYQRDIDKDRVEKAELIINEEVRSVTENEIPCFYTKGDSTDLFVNGEKVFSDYLQASPVAYALQRLDGFCSEDLKRQLKIIELALRASTPHEQFKPCSIALGNLSAGEHSAKQVAQTALFSLPGVFCGMEQGRTSVSFVSSGFSLYSGLSGVMCMFAAILRKTGKLEYRDMLLKCYENFAEILLSDNTCVELSKGNLSLGSSYIGMMSALLHIYELTGLNEFRQGAEQLLKRMSFSDKAYSSDYLNGAGALPVILKRHGLPGAEGIVKKINSNFSADDLSLTGAAHGAAGLLLTLSAAKALGAEVSDGELLSLIAWENSHFSASHGNWRDLRTSQPSAFMSGWCSGAPGIGMARNEMLAYITNEKLRAVCREDVEKAKSFLSAQSPSKRDSLCCGTASRLMAASRLGVNTDETYAKLERAEKEDRLEFIHPAGTADINVSLMQGLSGVAYALAMYGDPLSGGMLL